MQGSSTTAATVPEAERLARANPNQKIKIPTPPLEPPARYEPSTLSIPEGAKEVYRTAGPREHYQLRVHEDYWTVDFDQYHPKHYPVQHALVDSPVYTLVAAGVLGAYFG